MSNRNIFNEPQKANEKLWKKVKPWMENKLKDLPILFNSSAYKSSLDKNDYVRRFFFIKSHYLFYKKREQSKHACGYFNLKWSTVEFNYEEGNKFGMIYEISIAKNDRFCCLYVKRDDRIEEWIEALSKVCVQTNFKDKFTMGKFIGSGSFARVRKGLFLFY